MESFKAGGVAQIEQDGDPIELVTKDSSDNLMSMMKQMMERVVKLEQKISSSDWNRYRNVRRALPTQERKPLVLPTEVVCRKCGNKGHYTQGFAVQLPGSKHGKETLLQLSRAGKGHHQRTQQTIEYLQLLQLQLIKFLQPFIVYLFLLLYILAQQFSD